MNEAAPRKIPVGLIIGGVVAVIVVIVVIVLWQTGVFDASSSTPTPGPTPGPAPLSQNVKNLKIMADSLTSCEANLDMSIWGDSIGIVAIPLANDCPAGTKQGENPGGILIQGGGFKSCVPTVITGSPPPGLIKRMFKCASVSNSPAQAIVQPSLPPGTIPSVMNPDGSIICPNGYWGTGTSTQAYCVLYSQSPSPYTSPAPSPYTSPAPV
jgi:hypothetical protein